MKDISEEISEILLKSLYISKWTKEKFMWCNRKKDIFIERDNWKLDNLQGEPKIRFALFNIKNIISFLKTA